MKAFILVGGYGTRLRPLTFSCPKSCVPFANKPMLQHQIEALQKLGVEEIIFNFNFQVSENLAGLRQFEEKYKIKMTYSKQQEATGTAGPLKFAQELIKANNKEGFILVFNADIICDYPLEKLVKFHKAHGKQGTIVLATVQDPSRFGVVLTEADGRVKQFIQKPKEFVSNKINAGIYILNVSVIDRIPARFTMLEKEVFPVMASEGQLYGMALENDFWYDIGQPKDYLIGQEGFLKYYKHQPVGEQFDGTVLVHESAKVDKGAKIGPNVVIGPGCVVQKGARIKNSTIFYNTKVLENSYISGSIISWNCQIGKWARVQGLTVIAEHVKIKDEVRVTQSTVMSQKQIGNNLEAGSIIM